ncbi:MAG TPA: ABC transporter permease [Lacipirellulaceae bacterium]|nr:ABC transporter permease [Lacipirellulaceae bacterium]
MVPLKYNLRSIRARKVGSLMTIFGVGMVVWASIFAFGLYAGLEHALTVSVNPLDVIVLRQGSSSETGSAVTDASAKEIMNLPGIATASDGKPLAAPELVAIAYLPRRGGTGSTNVTVRGASAASRVLRDTFEIVEGSDLRPGVREAIVSRSLAERFKGLRMGEEFEVQDAVFKVVGYFSAGGGAAESEVWTDYRVLGQAIKRTGAAASVQLRAASMGDQDRIIKRITADEQIALKALTEKQYFADQAEQSQFLKIIGQIIASVLTVGAMFAVANTMYGAIASRAREIGTLRALGFGRFSVLTSFLLESLVLCILGAALGCLGALAIGEIRTGTMGGSFTELVFSFNFGPKVLLSGAILAVLMGLIGGILPAIRAVRMKVVDALREV